VSVETHFTEMLRNHPSSQATSLGALGALAHFVVDPHKTWPAAADALLWFKEHIALRVFDADVIDALRNPPNAVSPEIGKLRVRLRAPGNTAIHMWGKLKPVLVDAAKALRERKGDTFAGLPARDGTPAPTVAVAAMWVKRASEGVDWVRQVAGQIKTALIAEQTSDAAMQEHIAAVTPMIDRARGPIDARNPVLVNWFVKLHQKHGAAAVAAALAVKPGQKRTSTIPALPSFADVALRQSQAGTWGTKEEDAFKRQALAVITEIVRQQATVRVPRLPPATKETPAFDGMTLSVDVVPGMQMMSTFAAQDKQRSGLYGVMIGQLTDYGARRMQYSSVFASIENPYRAYVAATDGHRMAVLWTHGAGRSHPIPPIPEWDKLLAGGGKTINAARSVAVCGDATVSVSQSEFPDWTAVVPSKCTAMSINVRDLAVWLKVTMWARSGDTYSRPIRLTRDGEFTDSLSNVRPFALDYAPHSDIGFNPFYLYDACVFVLSTGVETATFHMNTATEPHAITTKDLMAVIMPMRLD